MMSYEGQVLEILCFLMLNKGLAVMIAIGVFFEVTINEFGNHKWYMNKTTIRK